MNIPTDTYTVTPETKLHELANELDRAYFWRCMADEDDNPVMESFWQSEASKLELEICYRNGVEVLQRYDVVNRIKGRDYAIYVTVAQYDSNEDLYI